MMRDRTRSPIVTGIRQSLFRFLRSRSGAAAIEFAFLGPVLALSAVVAADIGIGFYSKMQVQNSAQAGAEYAMAHGFDATAMSSAVTNTTPGSGISASPTPSTFCGCPNSDTVASVTCGTNCADGTAAGTYAKVTATKTYTTLIPYPGMSTSYTQTAVSTVRVQ
jgi:Flp pilus assembly protein TadG